jgi:hypothetical protein
MEAIMEDKKELIEDKTKFAKPDSPQFRAHYAQQRRKKRKERNEEDV